MVGSRQVDTRNRHSPAPSSSISDACKQKHEERYKYTFIHRQLCWKVLLAAVMDVIRCGRGWKISYAEPLNPNKSYQKKKNYLVHFTLWESTTQQYGRGANGKWYKTTHRSTVCGKPCVPHVQCPKGAKREAPNELRERNVLLLRQKLFPWS